MWFLGLLPGFWCLPGLHPSSWLTLAPLSSYQADAFERRERKQLSFFPNIFFEAAPGMASLEGGSPANRSYYHSLARPSGSLVKVTLGGKFSLRQSTNVFSFDCMNKIQNYPPCHQFLTCLLVLPNPLYDKVRHLLIAQHIPKACVRIDEQARQLMI